MTRGTEAVPDKVRENLDTLREFENSPREASPTQRTIEAASLFFGSPTCFVGWWRSRMRIAVDR